MNQASRQRGWRSRFGVLALIVLLVGCSTRPPLVQAPVYEAVGMASYYARKFQGRRTASGERYDMHALTAAHPALAFGARVEVTNLANGRRVEVRINDRGPFKKGRIIDLSYAAARQIGMLRRGVAKVRVRALP
jgi:rare lipoprotein A